MEIIRLLAKHDLIPSIGSEISSSALDSLRGDQIMEPALAGFDDIESRIPRLKPFRTGLV